MRRLGRTIRGLYNDASCQQFGFEKRGSAGFGVGISEPGAQPVVNGDFTFSMMSFSILEYPMKTAGGLRAL
ncbi:hypothetical protein GOZ81_11280 [Agrobacterium vitis]|uniref:hypothetical protein n=1 Tax=Agrobacterium vitis TaxID=373 RepID=UPI0012E8B56C|nr:hypothetical protein [Agrobacterium vitis]MVA71660.1 hypothetical protein [Agrobacterium vitis]